MRNRRTRSQPITGASNYTAPRQRGRRPTNSAPDEWIERLGHRVTVTTTGCWQVGNNPHLYPKVKIQGTWETAHRLVYQLAKGVIPDDWFVHHQCGTPACINPAHLEVMSPGDHARHHAQLRAARA